MNPEEFKFKNNQARYEIGRSLIEIEPTAILELYELYFDVGIEPFRFHAGTNNLTKNIIWNANEYYSTAIEVEGFESNIIGRLPRPKVTVSNSDFVISNILRDYSDFRNGKFVRIKVFLKHLDDINFEDGINPFGTANELMYISKEKYIVSQKIIENKQLIQFELITPFDLQSLETATRSVHARYCTWQYRGQGCNYQGDLICQDNDKDFSAMPKKHLKNQNGFINTDFLSTIKNYEWKESIDYDYGDIVFVINQDINGLKDPPRTWFVCLTPHTSTKLNSPNLSVNLWQKDGCSKTISACKKRFQNYFYEAFLGKTDILDRYTAYNDTLEVNSVLPFGGFPGTDKFKYE